MDKIKLLRRLGLTEYEARAYISLAKLGPSTVREIVLNSNLPRNKTYEALRRLEEKNKVMSLPVSPRKYKIMNPELFKREIRELSKSVDSLIKIIEQPKVTEFKDLFWIIKGRRAVVEKLASINTKVKREIISCSELDKMFYKNMRIIKGAVERGVKVKFITKYRKENIKYYRRWLGIGVKIRVFNERLFGPLLPRISVFDGIIARLTIGKPEVKDEDNYITLWTESKAFAQMLRNHFMNMWKNSKPIEKYLKE